MKLTEAGFITDIEEDVFWHEVKKNCSQYISALNESLGNTLYRGMDTGGKPFGKKLIRSDRKSLMQQSYPTAKWVSVANALYNRIVYEKTGIKNFRNNVSYCSLGDANEEYGTGCFIFPINGTRYFATPDTLDSATDRDDIFGFFWEYMLQDQEDFLKSIHAYTGSVFEDQAKNNLADYLQSNPEVENKMFGLFLTEDSSFENWRQYHFLFHEAKPDDFHNLQHEEEVALYGSPYYYYYDIAGHQTGALFSAVGIIK